jgi:hypothetical protein
LYNRVIAKQDQEIKMVKAITNRLRVFAFGIAVAFMGLISPDKTIQAVDAALNRQDSIDSEVDRLAK